MANFTMYDREREFKWQIECQLSGGTYAYIDAEDIYSGRLTRQISSGEGIEVGSCYVSELDLTIVASALPSNVVSVKPYFRLLTSTEIVDDVVRKYYTPYNLGVFKIASTKRKEYGRIDLVCYDKMADLDTLITPAAYTELLASDWKPFYLLDWIATKVGVTYTFTQAGIEAMPNGTLYFKLAEETSNIKTYRDLLQYVCMLIGAYGIFDEDGHLNIKTFADTTSYSLPASFRFSESFGDVPISYSGVELTVKNVTTMFGNANNTVVTLSDNPFLYNLSTLNQTTDYATFIMLFLRNIYTEFQGLSYYAGEFEIPPDATLNVGRLLAVTGGGASSTINCFLQKIDVNFDGRMMLSCGNPNTYVTRTQNRTTTSIANLTNRIESLESAGSGKEVLTSTADPSITDGNNDNVWFKYTLQAGLKFDNGTIYPNWYYMGCFRAEYSGYGEGWCYVWANNYPIPQDVNTGEGYVFPFLEYNAGVRILKLGIRCHKDRYAQIVDTAAVTFYVVGGGYPTGKYFTGTWMYCDMDANYQYYFGINIWVSGLLLGVALSTPQDAVTTTRQYVAIDGVSTLTNIAKRTNAEWVKINGEWVLVSEDIGSEVIVTPTLTEGTEIGEIEVSGNSKKLYAPTVSATQTQTSGTEIGNITVGSTSTTLYAPTPQSVSVTQTLSSGTEIGSITIDNNTTTLYAPSGSGSNVTVTPITTAGTNIADIEVDGTIYQLFAPNSGGGGGSGSGYTETSLWSGYKSDTGTISLNGSVENYDVILIKVTSHPSQPSTQYYESYFTILPSDIVYNQNSQYSILVVRGYVEYGNGSIDCYFSDSTSFVIRTINISNTASQVKPAVLEVIGLKFSGGSSGHNYSTTEQVVGTWIDGSTIYECTYDLGSDLTLQESTWTDSGITAPTNANRCIKAEGIQSDGTSTCIMASITSTNITVQSTRNSGDVIRYLTIQYTKTS